MVGTVVILVALGGLTWLLYRPRLQRSDFYQAMTVPLANIMDVGFLVLAAVMVALAGWDAPIMMAALVAMAILMGGVMGYNIYNYEPLIGHHDRVHAVAGLSRWALVGASIVNISYYLLLLGTMLLAPFGVRSEDAFSATAASIVVAIGVFAWFRGLDPILTFGQRVTAFNLAAVVAVLVGFVAYNVWKVATGDWSLPEYNPPTGTQEMRQMLGFFAVVQGFEASRYMAERYPARLRVATMRWAQVISGLVFVALLLSSLILFAEVRPEVNAVAIIEIGKVVSPILPFVILLTAVSSQVSAVANAIANRSDLLVEAVPGLSERKYTYPLLIVPIVAIVLLVNVTDAIALASRVFASYYVLQCGVAIVLASRRREWLWLAGSVGVGLLMLTIMVFGLSV